MQPRSEHPLAEQYTLTCQHDGCGAVRIYDQVGSAGLVLGSMVPYVHCLRCQRKTMKVTIVPARPEQPKPVGFTRIPTR